MSALGVVGVVVSVVVGWEGPSSCGRGRVVVVVQLALFRRGRRRRGGVVVVVLCVVVMSVCPG